MTYSPATPQEAMMDAPVEMEALPQRTLRKVVRLSGYSMDVATGVIHWRGNRLSLAREEHELLSTLLRRAGQILSREHLASLLGASADSVDRRMLALVRALDQAGVHCRPRHAAGLGYILWR
ncbi:MAG TPA: winged helix-turn-helix domain-containing protein [Ktedonobacterales bacterium]